MHGPETRTALEGLMRGPTGHDERLVPEVADSGNLAFHLKRYQFAIPYCAGKTVVDLGTGVGYGAQLLTTGARRVVGVDYDRDAVHYARRRYPAPTLHLLAGDALAIPLKAGAAQVAVAFEVIEHLSSHRVFLQEVSRLLAPDGRLLISTPNRQTTTLFRRKARFRYDAHVSEVDHEAFVAELRSHFAHVRLLGMRLRGRGIYATLRALDIWNWRLRLFTAPQIQFLRERLFRVPAGTTEPEDVVVSPDQLRQANFFVAVCHGKRA